MLLLDFLIAWSCRLPRDEMESVQGHQSITVLMQIIVTNIDLGKMAKKQLAEEIVTLQRRGKES